MKKYRKKPVVIEAVQFTGEKDNVTEILNWAIEEFNEKTKNKNPADIVVEQVPNILMPHHLVIKTLEGDHRADISD